jgi:acetyl esterase/lipase
MGGVSAVLSVEAREARRRGDLLPQPIPVSPLAEDTEIAGVPVRVFTPPKPRATVMHLHGGGFVYGAARLQDARLEQLAVACTSTVVSVEYRLAPEHPHPAATDDCEAVARELVARGTEVAVVGESAGANLAVAMLLRLRDRPGVAELRAAALVGGVYDLELGLFAETGDVSLTRAELNLLIDAYADDTPRSDPQLSPVHADVRGLPPALFVVGSLDPLLQDSARLAERWWEAGNSVQLEVVAGGVHGLDASVRVQAFLCGRLGGA